MGRTVYFNGNILTMDNQNATAKAVVVQAGRIVSTKAAAAVSVIKGYDKPHDSIGKFSKTAPADSASDINDMRSQPSEVPRGDSSTRFVDLRGATMLPAFLDPHSHFSGYAMAQLQVPLEEAVSFGEIVEKIKAFITAQHIPAGAWIIGKGYDHNQLAEHAHPTAAVLDQAAPDNPVMIQHQSGHMGVFNTTALRLLCVTAQTSSPSGGRIAVENGTPTGYMEENAFIEYQKKVPVPSAKDLMDAYISAQDKYASYGITTVQEGMLVSQLVPLYQMLTQNRLLKLDVVGYADAKDAKSLLPALADCRMVYKNHFKLGGLKIFLDGSPQGRTAWMRAPYENSPDYCGYNTLTDEQVTDFVRLAASESLQLLAHCNGDAAATQYLRACAQVESEGLPLNEIRPVLVHGQLLGPDQLPEVKRLGIIPSFFAAHVYHWGDVHIQNFGFKRASHISPAASALANGVPFTFHQDTPVIEPDIMETIWCSVNRLTKSGVRLDAEAIPVMDALKAVTINAAYQYFEEDEKGSIAPGKRADFVILDKNPLTVSTMELKNIKVLQTIKDGEIIYER